MIEERNQEKMLAVKELLLANMSELEKEIRAWRAELDMTIRTLYLLMRFKEHLKTEGGVLAINKNAAFWRVYQYSLITNLLIGTRRIFDKSADAKTPKKLIEKCKQEVDQFSVVAFEARKVKGLDVRPFWLDEYLLQHVSLTVPDFKALWGLVKSCSHSLLANNDYYNISNEIIAHALSLDDKHINDELSRVEITVVEKSLLSLHFALDKILHNYTMGRILHDGAEIMGYPHKKDVFDSLDKMLFSME